MWQRSPSRSGSPHPTVTTRHSGYFPEIPKVLDFPSKLQLPDSWDTNGHANSDQAFQITPRWEAMVWSTTQIRMG